MSHIIDMNGNPISSKTMNSSTTTAVAEKTDTAEKKEEALFIQTPIFILFGEYLGFVSAFIEHAENWCNPTKPMPRKSIQTLLEREARCIYDAMLEIWSEEEVNKLYKNFYPCGLDELEADLIYKRKKNGDDLPF